MSAQSGAIGRLVEELAGEALNNHLRNVRSYSQLRRLITNGELTDREVNEAYSEYARENATAYRKAAADLTIRYQQDLSDLGARYSDDFYQQILNGHRAGPRPPAPGPAAADGDGDGDGGIERIPIELHGRVGRELVSRFTIENTDPTPTTVEFEFEPCRAPHGETFHAPITVQPTRVELEPGGSAEILLRLALMPSVFVPGLIYHQTIRPVGGAPVALDITFWVEDDDQPPPGPAPNGHPTADPIAMPPGAAAEVKATTKAPATPAAAKPSVVGPAAKAATKVPAATKAATRKAATKQAPAKKATATKKATARKAATKKATAKKVAAKRAPAKAAAKQAPAKKAAVAKAAGGRSS